jgi:hypothetical protein
LTPRRGETAESRKILMKGHGDGSSSIEPIPAERAPWSCVLDGVIPMDDAAGA